MFFSDKNPKLDGLIGIVIIRTAGGIYEREMSIHYWFSAMTEMSSFFSSHLMKSIKITLPRLAAVILMLIREPI